MSRRRIAILAALPRELKPLVRGWTRAKASRNIHMWTHGDADGDELVAVCAGMGAEAVRRAFGAAEGRGALDLVISYGLAGATGPGWRVGEVCCPTEVIDAQTGERYSMGEGDRPLRLATAIRTADAAEKIRLRSTYRAALVDMEAATVARMAAMRGLPMGCFKAISDAAEAELPDIDRFVDAEGQLRTARFVAYLALRPGYWRAVARLAKASSVASAALAKSTQSFLRHKDWAHTQRTGRFDEA